MLEDSILGYHNHNNRNTQVFYRIPMQKLILGEEN